MPATIGPITTAFIGAGGAVIGGALTSTAQVWLDARRARRERKAEQRREEAAKRQAVRLVIEELGEALNLLEDAVRRRRWWEQPRQLSTATWNEYRPILAQYIESPTSWAVVAAGYDSVNRLNWLVHYRWEQSRETFERNKAGGVTEPFERPRADLFPADRTRDAWRSIRFGIGELERTIQVMGPASRMLGEPSDTERELWPNGDGDEFSGEPEVDWFDPSERR